MNYHIHANTFAIKTSGINRGIGRSSPDPFLAMKLTLILSLAFCIHASGNVLAQKVRIKVENATFKSVIQSIQQQTDYSFIIKDEFITRSQPVTIDAKGEDIMDVLPVLFHNQPFGYIVSGRVISVVPKATKKNHLNQMSVHGRVTDSLGSPLEGVTVINREIGRKTMTDTKGDFRLENIPEGSILEFRLLSYESYEVAVHSGTLNIVLKLVPSQIEEVIVNAGYYTVRDRERTGSISRVTSEQIDKQPVNNILGAISANIPGVEILQSTGVPGGGFSVRVRGINSISQGSEPLYIVNGVPFNSTPLNLNSLMTPHPSPLANINPNDIESLEVLKDADATAIYGSRGANGVVLITTKQGSIGKPRATLAISQGLSRVGKKLDLMDTEEYLAMRWEALGNDDIEASGTDFDLNGSWDEGRNTNWQKELIGNAAPMTNVQASLSGGSNNLTYLLGGGFYREKTVYPGNHSYKRSTGNVSLQYSSTNRKLYISFDSGYGVTNSNLFVSDITSYILLPPHYPELIDEEGLLNWGSGSMYVNPLAIIQRPNEAKTTNLVSNLTGRYEILPYLHIRAIIGYNAMYRKEFDATPLFTMSPQSNSGPTQRVSNFNNNSADNWSAEGQLEYEKEIGKGTLSALLGTTFQESALDYQRIRATGFTSDAIMGNIGAASTLSPLAEYSQYRYTALYGRLNYTYNGRYLINLTGRRDGSTRFGMGKRFANFGAIGAAWIISGESFVKDALPFISFAKIRGSYGITGNDQIPDYGYLELWRTGDTYEGVATLVPAKLANPNYAWEVNRKMEAAADLAFLNDRINLSASYYYNRSSNQLVSNQLPPSTGFIGIQDNLSALIQNTGWEFEIHSINLSSNGFHWSSSFNLSIPKNKLIDYPGLETSTNSSLFAVGKPLSIDKLYDMNVDPNTGLYRYLDYDGSGMIDTEDRHVIAFNGRQYYGGLQNSLSYKGVSFSFLFQFVKQGGSSDLSMFGTPGRFRFNTPSDNQLDIYGDRWKKEGDFSDYQKFSTLSAANTSRSNAISRGTFAVVDASFIRLKNVELSYTLPSYLSQRLALNSARVFLQGQNLFTITPYRGLDPETQSNRLPLLQVFIAGIQVSI